VIDALEGPDGEPRSVVSVLHALEADGVDTDVDAVRSALRSLEDKGVVEVVRKTVPTFRLAIGRDAIEVEVLEPPADA
jgi:Fe2+ or Zn2+ uptake regulation protein